GITPSGQMIGATKKPACVAMSQIWFRSLNRRNSTLDASERPMVIVTSAAITNRNAANEARLGLRPSQIRYVVTTTTKTIRVMKALAIEVTTIIDRGKRAFVSR